MLKVENTQYKEIVLCLLCPKYVVRVERYGFLLLVYSHRGYLSYNTTNLWLCVPNTYSNRTEDQNSTFFLKGVCCKKTIFSLLSPWDTSMVLRGHIVIQLLESQYFRVKELSKVNHPPESHAILWPGQWYYQEKHSSRKIGLNPINYMRGNKRVLKFKNYYQHHKNTHTWYTA